MDLKDTIQGMTSEDYKDRFIAEYQQVVIRSHKLEDLLKRIKNNETTFKPDCPLGLLEDQLKAMLIYIRYLEIRAARYEDINLEEVEI